MSNRLFSLSVVGLVVFAIALPGRVELPAAPHRDDSKGQQCKPPRRPWPSSTR